MQGEFFGEIPAGPNPVNGFGRADLSFLNPEAMGTVLFDDDPLRAVATLEPDSSNSGSRTRTKPSRSL